MNFEVNDLVRIKSARSIGIGCIAKVNSKNYTVNVGTEGSMKVKESNLEKIDTSKCKTVTSREYGSRILSDKSTLNRVILGNELREYVGIGWVTLRVVTEDDLTKYPRVV